ncbi:hypothetical protein SPRG_09324 [Saprolegnia parasitica CBS 223.65]|uniref:Uncharacterized protein n=1 Tax=Saprolegnia parasitica (strain CBS 223.65) TaxID=695850 RepID=A0A067C4D7_SAPPC|nr:hypothetical protein SPRG_09324 [Saprolegnia parasitica CBS 223.65]KDO25383.1 hypothetical protein SPRG_09324 [Saprolegnia parasitica CBS 223.65]|eukprot:XP_012203811.1 hypothetical protein SPRG_09324 [Saprolegnia parasitica CBS 223.65]
MDALEPVVVPLPRVVCMPSAATANAAVPPMRLSAEQQRHVRALRHHAFRRVQEHHFNCAAILHGSLATRPVAFPDADEETASAAAEATLRAQIQELTAVNLELETSLAAATAETEDRLAKRGWDDVLVSL